MSLGVYSYFAAAIAFSFFSVLLISSWRSLQGKLLLAVSVASVLWAGSAALVAYQESLQLWLYQFFEILRNCFWYVFLLLLLKQASGCAEGYRKFANRALLASLSFAFLLIVNETFWVIGSLNLSIIGHILLALTGLAIIEQLVRNTAPRYRWATKYLYVGAGVTFAFDFYLYADALLFGALDQVIWQARGFINLAVVPLLALAAARNKDWALNIFVSRDIVLNSTAILAGGIYLVLMASAAFYLREFGGSWGRMGQFVFFTLAVILLIAVLMSSQLRSRFKVFVVKHFYKNKYDYRLEWLRFNEDLDYKVAAEKRFSVVIEALAHIVEARAGLLWLKDETGCYKNSASWQSKLIEADMDNQSSLIQFLNSGGYIINLRQLDERSDEYSDLELPACLSGINNPWLIVPLFMSDTLVGFIILCSPLVDRSINWEDRDLLKTAAQQIASHITVLQTSDALAESRQFEVFTRLSAYMVHDLKNIASELDLVAKNARKYRHNPEFVDDAFSTIENAVNDIRRLLEQLRSKQTQQEKKIVLDLVELADGVINMKKHTKPFPQLKSECERAPILAERKRLANVIAHLIDNAQQATNDDGRIQVTVMSDDNTSIVEIVDDGCGMNTDFVTNRLFKPFDTTKGNAGMGIGMYESREFVRQLGGDIQVTSEVDKGTMICLRIPRYDGGLGEQENLQHSVA